MFFQGVASTTWTTNAEPETMVPVGTDAFALLSGNMVVVYNLKNDSKAYFKGDNAQTCAGISMLAGHLRFPVFAVVEAVLQPKIYIITYPDMEKLHTLYDAENLKYVDMTFSDYNYLVTLGDYPKYKLSLWGIQSGDCLASTLTYKKCNRNALSCMKTDFQGVTQYSSSRRQVLVWGTFREDDRTKLVELATIELSNDFRLSDYFSITYWEEPNPFMVSDLGDLYQINIAQMSLKFVWSTPKSKCCRHQLFYNKMGLLISDGEDIYFVKKRPGQDKGWQLEWQLENSDGSIKKIVSDYNNQMNAVSSLGNIYRIQFAEEAAFLEPKMTSNCVVMDYVNVKGIKDEVVLVLIEGGELRMVDMIRMNALSKVTIEGAARIQAHNTNALVAVGTTTGVVHTVNYEKIRAPVITSSVLIDEGLQIDRISLYDHCYFVKDNFNGFHIFMSHHKKTVSLERESTEWSIMDTMLYDEQHAIVFVDYKNEYFVNYATEAWIYSWNFETSQVQCSEYDLPFKYREFAFLQSTPTEVEFAAIRLHEFVIDFFVLSKNSILNIVNSCQTIHLTHINRLCGSRNLLTADTQSIVLHFRTHKKSKTAYAISRALLCYYVPQTILKMDECFNGKFLLVLNTHGRLTSYRLPSLIDSVRENTFDSTVIYKPIVPRKIGPKNLFQTQVVEVAEITQHDEDLREALFKELHALEKAMKELIEFDISVRGQLEDINFKKFCLNHKWLGILNEEARILNETENTIIENAITDENRILNWILDLIRGNSTVFSTKLRSIFSSINAESYSTRSASPELLDRYDLFRFYEMEPMEDEVEEVPEPNEDSDELGEEEEEEVVKRKFLKHYVLEKGANVYDHVMAKDFELQDPRIVTCNQLYNEEAKLAIILIEALKLEFNKTFILSKNFKEETLNNVLSTNATLEKIYSNMNCMLCLLKMEQFVPPQLSVPEWKKDENIQKILTVDDSEIKAINRRKKIAVQAVRISGRMLLWSNEFWKRALIIMMDGVLEKLWEEEIKKTPFPPEFMLKKQEHEFNLEENKLKREYDAKLAQLEEDRKKYLRILRDNEVKTHALKKVFVLRLNEHIAAINILKMKYDYAIKHERLRLLNLKTTNFKRIALKKEVKKHRNRMHDLESYIGRYEKIVEYCERVRAEYKVQHDTLLTRDRQLDRQFKGSYLSSVPQNLSAEMMKIYRKRPKLAPKVFNTARICSDMARRVVAKQSKQKFPLSQDLKDFLDFVRSLDSPENCPNTLDSKFWDTFVRLRRSKIESELRMKGIAIQMSEIPKPIAFFTEEIKKLKQARGEAQLATLETSREYFDVIQNQRMELVLLFGQVEIQCHSGDMTVLNSSVLMNVDDIVQVNSLIMTAGDKKLKAMQRVALFRRKVIYTEWEHKVVRANRDYLKFVLELIERCKVNYEFLEVLRNWNRVKELQASTTRVGYLEEVRAKRLAAYKTQIERIQARIDESRRQLEEKKHQNHITDNEVTDLKVDVFFVANRRDLLGEENMQRFMDSRMARAMRLGKLSREVQADYVKILELGTILQITRMRSEPMLPPAQPECQPLEELIEC